MRNLSLPCCAIVINWLEEVNVMNRLSRFVGIAASCVVALGLAKQQACAAGVSIDNEALEKLKVGMTQTLDERGLIRRFGELQTEVRTASQAGLLDAHTATQLLQRIESERHRMMHLFANGRLSFSNSIRATQITNRLECLIRLGAKGRNPASAAGLTDLINSAYDSLFLNKQDAQNLLAKVRMAAADQNASLRDTHAEIIQTLVSAQNALPDLNKRQVEIATAISTAEKARKFRAGQASALRKQLDAIVDEQSHFIKINSETPLTERQVILIADQLDKLSLQLPGGFSSLATRTAHEHAIAESGKAKLPVTVVSPPVTHSFEDAEMLNGVRTTRDEVPVELPVMDPTGTGVLRPQARSSRVQVTEMSSSSSNSPVGQNSNPTRNQTGGVMPPTPSAPTVRPSSVSRM